MKTKVVVDSNILFSALIQQSSGIRSKLFSDEYEFYSPTFLFLELFTHKEKLLKASKLNEGELMSLLLNIFHRVNFVNDTFISTGNLISAYKLCKHVDEKDSPFVALALELGAKFWTGDLQLKLELQRKGFHDIFE